MSKYDNYSEEQTLIEMTCNDHSEYMCLRKHKKGWFVYYDYGFETGSEDCFDLPDFYTDTNELLQVIANTMWDEWCIGSSQAEFEDFMFDCDFGENEYASKLYELLLDKYEEEFGESYEDDEEDE